MRAVQDTAWQLRQQRVRALGTLLENGPHWMIADLAAMHAGIVHVPLPTFFTAQQQAHALDAAGVDTVLADPRAAPALAALGFAPAAGSEQQPGRMLLQRTVAPVAMPEGTAKITFTSGTTGAPKGVCLDAEPMLAAAASIVRATETLDIAQHLCVLPFPVLLESVAGVLAPLLRGSTCIALSPLQVGVSGSSSFSPAQLTEAVLSHQAHSVILLPQMLRAWTEWLRAKSMSAPKSLEFVAVGGAAVGARLLADARAQGLPAYEGYGLSEGASVQTLNLPGADRPGSAGRALPHARVRVAPDGEIEVGGALFLGYLGDSRRLPEWWPTGDLGALDADGFVHIRGRKSNVLITSYGRNVSPEWVETALRSEPAIAQAVVLGDAQPALDAVIWPAVGASDAAVDAAVQSANAQLPDYARVRHWVRALVPFDADHGMATANGRPRRMAVEARHGNALRALAAGALV
jgi:long-subunit acyl-CoA synthetase (AMP-forming)